MANSEGKSKNTNDGIKREPVPYRCDFTGIARIANQIRECITETQLEFLKRTPFGAFYSLFHYDNMLDKSSLKLTHTAILNILNCYDLNLKKFRIGTELLTMTAKDIAILYGMKLEGKILPVFPRGAKKKNETNSFVVEYSNTQTGKFMKEKIEAAILRMAGKSNHAVEFVQLVILYMCITIFFVNQAGNTLGGNFFENIKDLETINSISWPHMIFDYVMNSLIKNHNDRLRVSGCVLSFVYWVSEHSDTGVDSRMHRQADQFPRVGRSRLSDIVNELPVDLATLRTYEYYLERLTSKEEELIGGPMEYGEFLSIDDEERESDDEEMKRVKERLKTRVCVIQGQADRISKLESQLKSKFTGTENELSTPGKKRIFLILGLNGVLVSFDKGVPVLRRCCLDFVLFCLDSFDQVLFWSAMPRSDTEEAMEKVLPQNLRPRFHFQIWCRNECIDSGLRYPDGKPWYLKTTFKIKTHYPDSLYTERNIIMVDESPLCTVLNPPNTAVFPKPWVCEDSYDEALSESGDIYHFLKGLPNEGDIQEYVETKQPDSFDKKKADERISEVWATTTYADRLRDIRNQMGDTSLGAPCGYTGNTNHGLRQFRR